MARRSSCAHKVPTVRGGGGGGAELRNHVTTENRLLYRRGRGIPEPRNHVKPTTISRGRATPETRNHGNPTTTSNCFSHLLVKSCPLGYYIAYSKVLLLSRLCLGQDVVFYCIYSEKTPAVFKPSTT